MTTLRGYGSNIVRNSWHLASSPIVRGLHSIDDVLAEKIKQSAHKLPSVKRLQDAAAAALENENHFFSSTLDILGIDFVLSGSGAGVFDAPRDGPLLITANHPYGLIDAFILGALLERRGDRFRILANGAGDIAIAFPELLERTNDHFLLLDLRETKEAEIQRIQKLHHARGLLKDGVSLVVFPAAHRSRPVGSGGYAVDAPWNGGFALMLGSSDNTRLLPVFFEKRNSLLEQSLYLFSMWLIDHEFELGKLLRSGLTTRQTGRRQTVQVRIGEPLTKTDLKQAVDRANASADVKKGFSAVSAEVMRARTDSLHMPPPPSVAGRVFESLTNFRRSFG